MPQEYLDTKSHEIGRCYRLFQPDMAVVLSNGSRRRNNPITTNPYQHDFSGVFGLPKSQGSRKLSVPLIEPLSVRLQEIDKDEEDDDGTITVEPNFDAIGLSKHTQESVICRRNPPDKKDFGSGEYINSAIITMQRRGLCARELNKVLPPFNTTQCSLSRKDVKDQQPPPLPPKPKNGRSWTNWRMLPGAVQSRLNRKVERRLFKQPINQPCIPKSEVPVNMVR